MIRLAFNLILILFAALLLSACQPIEPLDMSAVQAAEVDDGLGKRIAGSYLVDAREFGLPGDAPDLVYRMLFTLTADGTVNYEVSMAFGADHRPRFKSGGHGTWTQTGPHEITWTTLSFDHGQEEVHAELGPFNPHATTVRISAVTTFAEDFKTLTTKTNVAVMLADLDPLDPASEPIFPAFQGEHSGRRIPAMFGHEE